MKLFAIITAGLMAAGSGAYYLHSNSPCHSNADCPVAQAGGCCTPGQSDKPICCTIPCPACSIDCLACCDACEVCCTAGVQAPVSAKVADKPSCCAGASKVTATKANCCVPGADCCISACCSDVENAVAKPVANEERCSVCASPAHVATTAALAGIGAK